MRSEKMKYDREVGQGEVRAELQHDVFGVENDTPASREC